MITRTIVVILGYLCVAGFVANGQYCNSTNTCPSNQQCSAIASCNWGYCTCPSSGMKYNASTCVTPTVNVGGNCSFSSDCKGTNTYCNSTNQCACLSSTYTVKSDSSDCTSPPATPLNGNCTITTSTCGLFAACSANNTCQCSPTCTPVGGSNKADCRPMVPNDPCSNVTDCGPTTVYSACKNANCNTGTYQCNSGYKWVTSDTLSFDYGCVPNSASTNVAAGQPCADGTVNNNYQLCGTGLTCFACPESPSSATCRSNVPVGDASNVQVNIMTLVSALVFFRFAA